MLDALTMVFVSQMLDEKSLLYELFEELRPQHGEFRAEKVQVIAHARVQILGYPHVIVFVAEYVEFRVNVGLAYSHLRIIRQKSHTKVEILQKGGIGLQQTPTQDSVRLRGSRVLPGSYL